MDGFEKSAKCNLAPAGAKLENTLLVKDVPGQFYIPIKDFLSIGFTLHRTIIFKVKNLQRRLFYFHQAGSLRLGIILCKDMEKSSVEFFIQDYKKPMGVSTYKEMSEKIKKNLPSIEQLEKLLDSTEEDG